jgi:hemoglobin
MLVVSCQAKLHNEFCAGSIYLIVIYKFSKMNVERKDILEREDVRILVDKFYDKVKFDELLQPVFSHVDWPQHLPIMYNFWSSMLLGDQSYSGNPLQKHLPLPIAKNHFSRWLALFKKTVDENFEGEKAEEVKTRADSIAKIFQFKMGLVT